MPAYDGTLSQQTDKLMSPMRQFKSVSMHHTPDNDSGHHVYADYFNLSEAPFSITPDPEFLYFSETHQSAMEKIKYGIENRLGFSVLTGEVGTGKTTLCRALLDELQDKAPTVYIINPTLSSREMLTAILEDLGIGTPSAFTKKDLIDRLNQFLLAHKTRGRVVIIIDDAQTMPLSTLEDLRLLSNLETDKHKLLQMLLVGQPELRHHLNQPKMRQLKQRVAISCNLDYLNPGEVDGYIRQRLYVAGNKGRLRFSSNAVKLIHRQSEGIPRVINKICDMALTAAYTANSYAVVTRHIKAAIDEMIEVHNPKAPSSGRNRGPSNRRRPQRLIAATMVGLLMMGLGFFGYKTGLFPTRIMQRLLLGPPFEIHLPTVFKPKPTTAAPNGESS